MNNESRIVPQTEKISVCALYGAQGYRQVLALKFDIGDKVRIKDGGGVREVTSIELTLQDTVLYGLDFGDAIWVDDELELVEEANK